MIFVVHLIFFIQHTTGCPDGFYGVDCDIHCRYPSFGLGCQQSCNCTEEFCNHVQGCKTNQECPNGFYGEKCRDQCRYPNYGMQCQSLCTCESQLCNHISGCNFSTDCEDGCSGLLCNTSCSCTLKNCNHTNGCLDTSEHDEDEVPETFENAAIIGSCSLFILITIFLIIMVRKYISSKKQVNKHNYTPYTYYPFPRTC